MSSAVLLLATVAMVAVPSDSQLHICRSFQKGQVRLADKNSSTTHRSKHVEVCWRLGLYYYYWLPMCKQDGNHNVASFICQKINSNNTLAGQVVQFQLPSPEEFFIRSHGIGVNITCSTDSLGTCIFTARNCERVSSLGTTVCVYPHAPPNSPSNHLPSTTLTTAMSTSAFPGNCSAMVTSTNTTNDKKGRKNDKEKKKTTRSLCIKLVMVLGALLLLVLIIVVAIPLYWLWWRFMRPHNTESEVPLERCQAIRQDCEGTLDNPVYQLTPAPNKATSTKQLKQNTADKSGAKQTAASENIYNIPGDTTNTDTPKGESEYAVIIKRPAPAKEKEVQNKEAEDKIKGSIIYDKVPLIPTEDMSSKSED